MSLGLPLWSASSPSSNARVLDPLPVALGLLLAKIRSSPCSVRLELAMLGLELAFLAAFFVLLLATLGPSP